MFDYTADDFTVGVASKSKIKELFEVSFEFASEKNGLLYFRKRK